MDTCLEHSGHASRLSNLERGLTSMDKDISSAHRRIDGMKNWVIAGMASLIMQLLITIVLFWGKAKAGA